MFAFSLSPDKGMAERKRSWYLSGGEARLHNGPGGGSLAWGSCEGKVLWRESAEPAGCWVLGGKEPPTQGLLMLFSCAAGRLRLISILFSRLSRGRGLWSSLKCCPCLLTSILSVKCPGRLASRMEGRDRVIAAVPASPWGWTQMVGRPRSEACWEISLRPMLELSFSHLPAC